MSAAATAAGYLYASGRLRGRGAREQEEHKAPERPPARDKIRVAVLPASQEQGQEQGQEQRPRRQPKIEYRTRRRWSAE